MKAKQQTQIPSPEIRISQLPHVLINVAMTADGKIATVNRRISTFSSRVDREHMMGLRATVDAVMAGARTVDLARVNLGPGTSKYRRARSRRGLREYNLRVVVSGSGSLNPDAEIFRHRFSPIIILTTFRAGARRLGRLRAKADVVKVFGARQIDFKEALRWLRQFCGIRRLLCEGGGELNDALFRAGVVDELHLTICPKVFGGRTAPTLADGAAVSSLAGAARLQLKSMKRAGNELFLVYTRDGG